MTARHIARSARRRAGITQKQLAQRSGFPRETIARWEAGSNEPSFASLTRLVEACELELVTSLAQRDTSLDEAVRDQLTLTPGERLERLTPRDTRHQTVEALDWLARASTPAIVIGDVAAVLQGGPQRIRGPEIEFVSGDPVAASAEMRAAGLRPLDADSRWRELLRLEPWSLPAGGTLALASNVPGTGDFRDLRRDAKSLEVTPGVPVSVAHPLDLLRIADASPREGDWARRAALRALLAASSEMPRAA